jgi:hypothetical protein
MSDNKTPWQLWVESHPEENKQHITYDVNNPIPDELQSDIKGQPVEVRPWDLLNPNKARASEQTEKERLEICKKCPSYRKFAKQCKECGCIMPAKVKLADAFCPLGKWEAVEGENND